MVVDDDPDVITTIRLGLDKLSKKYRVTGVNSGKECIETLQAGEIPDIILLDIMMPDIDGWQVYKHLQKNEIWSDIPIIFVTAKDDEETMKKGIQTNTYCVKKPFEMKELQDVIERVLSEKIFFDV